MLCFHCGLPIPKHDLIRDLTSGRELHFCCQGCHGAWQIISGAGLDRYYQQRSGHTEGLPDGAFEEQWNEATLARYVVDIGGESTLTVLLDGIRCASCVWLIEHLLAREAGIISARINFATHRARIRFDPEHIGAARIFSLISALGYLPRPYTQEESDRLVAQTGRDLLLRFATAAFFSMQLMGYSFALYAGYFQGMSPHTHDLLQWCAALVTTPVVFYSGWPFLRGGWQSLLNKSPNMDLLVAIGVLSSYGYSCVALIKGDEVYFDSAATIVTLILLGRLLEHAARRRASAGIDRLLRLAPTVCHKFVNGILLEVDSATLIPGDQIQVRAGERFPVDGIIREGIIEINLAAVTGESLPLIHRPGDSVLAGTLNLSTVARIEVEAPVSDSYVARIATLVEEAQSRRAPLQQIADRISAIFIPAVILIAIATFGYWYLFGTGIQIPLLPAVAVLVVACPCALGLATPMAILVASGQGAAAGLLFRGGDILERTAELSDIAFDKTGTLTLGHPQVVAVVTHQCTESELLQLALMVEYGSDHPLARAIVRYAEDRLTTGPKYRGGAQSIPGAGVVLVDEEIGTIRLGRRDFVTSGGCYIPEQATAPRTEVYLAVNDRYYGCITLADRLRDESAGVVHDLKQRGLTTTLLTGDHHLVASQIGDTCQLDAVHAELSPQNKADWIAKLNDQGRKVLMIGDGINDAPALARADVGCSLAGGTAIALENAELVLTRADLTLLPYAIDLARQTKRIILQNFFWASIYNLSAIPLAASGRLIPVYAAAAMAMSSVCVIVNSLRLSRQRSPKCSARP